MPYMGEYRRWLESPEFSSDIKRELKETEGREEEIWDRFYHEPRFVSGELRGIMGAGIHTGNMYRLKKAMKKAERGEKLVVSFLGGSITQGSLSSTPQTCYAYLVYRWWKDAFPNADIVYVNAGIGGTTSQFGAARVEEDIISCGPDVVIIDFTVNDESTQLFKETYESLVRRLLNLETEPGVAALCNVHYESGASAYEIHKKVLDRYALPYVSVQETLYQGIRSGRIDRESISPDGLHPNDRGHRLLAEQFIELLEHVKAVKLDDCAGADRIHEIFPLTECCYEEARRIQNDDIHAVCHGFKRDLTPKNGITDLFKSGWAGLKKGDYLCIEAEGSCLAVQYRRSVNHPAPVAVAFLDDDRTHGIILDGNFDEEWGDSLWITTILHHGNPGKHKITIEITEGVESGQTPFYLVSVIETGSR